MRENNRQRWWPVILLPLALFACNDSPEAEGYSTAPEDTQALTAIEACEDWHPNDPGWVQFCQQVRAAAMQLLEHEDPLCAQYAQEILSADEDDRLRWLSGQPQDPEMVCITQGEPGVEGITYCYSAAYQDMPSSAIPHLVEHEGCHQYDIMHCTDAQTRSYPKQPAIGSGAYEANRCIGEELQPW